MAPQGEQLPLTALPVKGQCFKNPRIAMMRRKVTEQRHFEEPQSFIKIRSQVVHKELRFIVSPVTLSKCCNQRDSQLLWYVCHSLEVEPGLGFYLKTVH